MRTAILLWVWAVSCGVALAATDNADAVSAQFRAAFPNTPVETVRPSEVDGLYEVYTPGGLIYFAPEPGVVLFGEIYDLDGRAITQEKLLAHGGASLPAGEETVTLDVRSALVVGDGPRQLVEIIDPDCGYCRQAHEWISAHAKRKELTQLVIFKAIVGRPEAQARARAALCAPPEKRREALASVFERGLPKGPTECEGVDERLAVHAKEAAKLGPIGTPTFVVQGETVMGFYPDRLEGLLFDTGVQ